jgi:CHAT domain
MGSVQSTTVLFLAANPRDNVRLETNREYDQINSVLQTTPEGKGIKLLINHAVSTKNIQSLLMYNAPDIVHFSGHGSEEGALFFENEEAVGEEVNPEVLAELFRIINKNKLIRCVLLNACYSSKQAKSIVKYVNYVVGIPNDIDDEDAIEFSEGFYLSLGYSSDIRTAFEHGIVRLGLKGIRKNLPKLEVSKEILMTPVSAESIHDYNIEKKYDKIDYNLTIDTDKTEYGHGETITISGRVTVQRQSKDLIRIQIIDPSGSEYWFDQIEPKSDGSYSFSKIVQDDILILGRYNVIVEYSDMIEETTITLID